MRLIDAEAFLKTEIDRCGSNPLVGTCTSDNEYLSERLKKAPTIEVKPVVHAHWTNGDPLCPVCKKNKFEGLDADIWADWKPLYCPNCGAKMNEKENDK